LERIDVTDCLLGYNEATFAMYGVRFRLLDANRELHLVRPQPGLLASVWANLMVDDIQQVFDKALACGWSVLQPVSQTMEYGVSSAVLVDPCGHSWMLHQIHRVVAMEERMMLHEYE
jgi:PhnB protein